MKVVIIGGGAAGTVAAFELRKLNKDISITILEKGKHTEYSHCSLPYVIEGTVEKLSDIVLFHEDDYVKEDVDLKLDTEAVEVDDKLKTITYKNIGSGKKGKISYDVLVLAHGAHPFIPPIKDIEKSQYMTFTTYDDVEYLQKNIRSFDNAIIIGGGFIGVELGWGLIEQKKKVTIIERQPHILPGMFDQDMCSIVQKILEDKGMKVKTDVSIDDIQDLKLTSRDKLIVSTGIHVKDHFAKSLGLKFNRGIVVNDKMQSKKDIYCIGDCIEISKQDPKTKKSESITSWLGTSAVRQAQIAANNILNSSNPKKQLRFWTNNTAISRIGETVFGATGMTTEAAARKGIKTASARLKAYTRSEHCLDKKDIIIKLIADMKGYVLGAQIIGHEEVAGRLDLVSMAIQYKMKLSDLCSIDYCYNPSVAPIFEPLSVVADICQRKIGVLNARKK
ncbi:FAD-dependent oxidoreductase [Candidatus Woesearchaeota archaeon]|nr:FAD-dependent oxidoreductase [Candidatus Woesearchaeota archaeon]